MVNEILDLYIKICNHPPALLFFMINRIPIWKMSGGSIMDFEQKDISLQ
jgi:hypothetical protein